METNSPVNSVLVLGGGSAGFLAAITLKGRHPSIAVTLLRSKDIGIIGVGEGTTVAVTSHLHGYLGIDPGKFHREAHPVAKLGIRFLWGSRPYFDYAFAQQLDTKIPPLSKPTGFYVDDEMVDFGLSTAMMGRNKVFPRDNNGHPFIDCTFAYHLENETFVRFLENAAASIGIVILDGTVAEVQQNDHAVTGVQIDDGRLLKADLFVDCSGFKSVLLRQALKEPVIDYSSSLWCDRAVVGGWDRNPTEPIQPYTVAETMSSGWAWRIDHEHRINRGYVYCSRYQSDEQAEREFREKNPAVGPTRIVRFFSGRAERPWVKNVIAIGNAFGFVEPLEATSLGVICTSARNLAEMLADGDLVVRDTQRSLYNLLHTKAFDQIRWFLSLHYKFNTRLDTPFWNDCREKVDFSGVASIVDYFHENGPSALFRNALLDPADPFGVEGYLVMLVGQKVPYRKVYTLTDADRKTWGTFRQRFIAMAERALTVEQSIQQLKSPTFRWKREWFNAVTTPASVATATG